jgi:hypothetical protein
MCSKAAPRQAAGVFARLSCDTKFFEDEDDDEDDYESAGFGVARGND